MIVYFYVVDEQDHLVGVLPTRSILLSQENATVDETMIRSLITIPQSATVLVACECLMLHCLLAFSVFDEQQKTLDIVDVDLNTDELHDLDQREANEDLFQLVGGKVSEAQVSSWAAFRDRFPWLQASIGGGILAAFLTGRFEAELRQVVVLALFIPGGLGPGRSVAIQSVSLSLQALHGKRPTLSMTGKAAAASVDRRDVGSCLRFCSGLGCDLMVGSVDSDRLYPGRNHWRSHVSGADRRGDAECLALAHSRAPSSRRPRCTGVDRYGYADVIFPDRAGIDVKGFEWKRCSGSEASILRPT